MKMLNTRDKGVKRLVSIRKTMPSATITAYLALLIFRIGKNSGLMSERMRMIRKPKIISAQRSRLRKKKMVTGSTR